MTYSAHGKGPKGQRWAAFFNSLIKKVGAEGLVACLHPLELTPIPGGKVGITFDGFLAETYMVKDSARGEGRGYYLSSPFVVYRVVPNDTDIDGLWHVLTEHEHPVDGRFTRGWYPGGTYVMGYRHPASRTVYITTPGITGLVRGTMTGAATFTPGAAWCAVNKYDSEYYFPPEDWPCSNPFSVDDGEPVWAFWDETACSFVVTPVCD